jgi:hypothetical protein
VQRADTAEPRASGSGTRSLLRRAAKESDSGLHPVLLLKAPEAGGDLYSVRRFLYQNAPGSDNRDILSRWANVEDWYGSEAPDAYSPLLNTLIHENASKEEILAICSRGLQVGLRDERFDAARRFAVKSADLGVSQCGWHRMYKTNRSKEIESVFRAIGHYLRNGYLLAFRLPRRQRRPPGMSFGS